MEYCLGMDLGGTAIKFGVVDRDGNIVDTEQVPTLAETDNAETIMNNMKSAIKRVIEKNSNHRISAIGIGVPGGVDAENGKIIFLPNIHSLEGYPLGEDLKKSFGLPVFIDNDANNAARGEFLFGAAKGMKDFVLVTLGTGIGGGIFINGDIYEGVSNNSGEIGHLVVVPNGRQCGCGNFGCWEAYGSATAMIKKIKSYIERGIPTTLSKYYPDQFNIKVIEDEGKAGDKVAAEVFEEAVRYIGLGLASLINILNPEACIIGGGISNAGEWLLEKIKFYTRLSAMPRSFEHVKIILAKQANKAGLLGSAALGFMKK